MHEGTTRRGRSGRITGLAAGAAVAVVIGTAAAAPEACIDVYARGVLTLPFNPAFLHVAEFRDAQGRPRDGLLMSSFFNVEKDAAGVRVMRQAATRAPFMLAMTGAKVLLNSSGDKPAAPAMRPSSSASSKSSDSRRTMYSRETW